MNNYCFLNLQTKVIVIILLYPSCLSISKTKSVIRYCSPLSIYSRDQHALLLENYLPEDMSYQGKDYCSRA